ncbi:MAG TPA: hypothetical protein VFU97_15280 [Xanthobacteraceae bacterium]|nr:hypothetical protein [Xanthobacteraceae bacterium]
MTSSLKNPHTKTHWTARAGLAAIGFAAGLALLAAPAGAQAPPKDATVGMAPKTAAAERVLELTPAQRLAIYQSVTQTQKNNAAPIGFRPAVGAVVPSAIELKPVSDTLVKLVPQASDLSIGMIEKQVILVDPATRQVVAVVTQEPDTAVH